MKRLFLILQASTLVVAQVTFSMAMAQNLSTPTASTSVGGASASARTLNLPGKLSRAQLTEFLSNPQGLLKTNPIGGLELSDEVRQLMVTDPAAVIDVLLDLARSSNSAQAAAIGAGLGEAIKAIQAVDKSFGDQIAGRISASGLPNLVTGYNMTLANTQTLLSGTDGGVDGGADFGGGGDGGGGGGGVGGAVEGVAGGIVGGKSSSSTGGVSRNSESVTGSTARTNTAETFSSSGASTTCTTSVSPRQNC